MVEGFADRLVVVLDFDTTLDFDATSPIQSSSITSDAPTAVGMRVLLKAIRSTLGVLVTDSVGCLFSIDWVLDYISRIFGSGSSISNRTAMYS
jgi:hypothetical protein